MSPFVPYDDMRLTKAFFKVSEKENFDPVEYLHKVMEAEERAAKKPFMFKPIKFGKE